MANWVKLTTERGQVAQVNLDQVAAVTYTGPDEDLRAVLWLTATYQATGGTDPNESRIVVVIRDQAVAVRDAIDTRIARAAGERTHPE